MSRLVVIEGDLRILDALTATLLSTPKFFVNQLTASTRRVSRRQGPCEAPPRRRPNEHRPCPDEVRRICHSKSAPCRAIGDQGSPDRSHGRVPAHARFCLCTS